MDKPCETERAGDSCGAVCDAAKDAARGDGVTGVNGPDTERARACDESCGSDSDWRIDGGRCLPLVAYANEPFGGGENGCANVVLYGPADGGCEGCEYEVGMV